MARSILILLLLTGCANLEAARQARIAKINATDDAQCKSYGAAPGTQTYTECRMLIASQRANIEAAQQAAFSSAAMNAGATILSNQQAVMPPPPIQYPVPAAVPRVAVY